MLEPAYAKMAGLAYQMMVALGTAKFTEDDIEAVIQHPDLLNQLLLLKREDATIKKFRRMIDCDTLPTSFFEESRCTPAEKVFRHDTYGIVPWKSLKLRVIRPGKDCPSHMKRIDPDHRVPRYLIGEKLANVNICEYLRRYPHLAYECLRDWHYTSPLIFWGTVYEDDSPFGWAPGIHDDWRLAFYGIRVMENHTYDNSTLVIDD